MEKKSASKDGICNLMNILRRVGEYVCEIEEERKCVCVCVCVCVCERETGTETDKRSNKQ